MMNDKKCLMCKDGTCGGACTKSTAILLLRLILGIVFIYHGYAKITDIAGTQSFFAQIGLGNIALVYLAAYGEFIGGIFMILGLWVRATSVVLSIIMVVAIVTVHLKNGFGAMGGGYEYPLTLLVTTVAVGLLGAGKCSLPRLMSKKDNK